MRDMIGYLSNHSATTEGALTTTKKLNLREYWEAIGTENMMKIIAEVGSSFGYFRALKYGPKRPSATMALRIIEAANRLTPGWAPDLELMVRGVPAPGRKRVGRLTPPSPEFLAHQAKIQRKQERAA